MPMHKEYTAITLPAASGPVAGIVAPKNSYAYIGGIIGYETGGSSAVTYVIREGSATGKVLATIVCTAGKAGLPMVFAHPVKCNGIPYAVKAGSGTIAGSLLIA